MKQLLDLLLRKGFIPIQINLHDYDLIFLGTPVWSFSYAPPVKAFLAQAGIRGKKIALFCCYGGAVGKTWQHLERDLAGNRIVGKIGFKEPLKSDRTANVATVVGWVNEITGSNLE